MYAKRSLARLSEKHRLTDMGEIPARAAHSDMDRKSGITALALLRIRERERHARDEDEEREDRVVERQALPGAVPDLKVQPAALPAGHDPAEPADRILQPEDPDHVKAPEGVKRLQPFQSNAFQSQHITDKPNNAAQDRGEC